MACAFASGLPNWPARQVIVMKRLGFPSIHLACKHFVRQSLQFGHPHLLHLTGLATWPKCEVVTMEVSPQNIV